MEKYQYFNGVKFTRDEKTGYYLNSTIRKRMHRYVWEFYNGSIPKGYCVHHIDHNRGNNDISNLVIMKKNQHSKMHGDERAERFYRDMIENLNVKARPKASEWHGSEKGKEWHKKHYQECKEKLHLERDFVCEQCGKAFKSTQTNSKFCSNACKSAYRRSSGVDDVVRTCEICGKEFFVNKYSKSVTCSTSCANKLRRKRMTHETL